MLQTSMSIRFNAPVVREVYITPWAKTMANVHEQDFTALKGVVMIYTNMRCNSWCIDNAESAV